MKKAVAKDICKFIQRHFGNQYVIEPVDFGDGDLRRMERKADNLYQLGVYPKDANEADQVKILDRNEVRGKKAHEKYSDDPWAMIKVGLPKDYVETKVGFSDDGRITIYGKEMGPGSELEILEIVMDELRPLESQKDFQKSISALIAES